MTTAEPVIVWQYRCESCGELVWVVDDDFSEGTALIECACGGTSTVIQGDVAASLISFLEH